MWRCCRHNMCIDPKRGIAIPRAMKPYLIEVSSLPLAHNAQHSTIVSLAYCTVLRAAAFSAGWPSALATYIAHDVYYRVTVL